MKYFSFPLFLFKGKFTFWYKIYLHSKKIYFSFNCPSSYDSPPPFKSVDGPDFLLLFFKIQIFIIWVLLAISWLFFFLIQQSTEGNKGNPHNPPKIHLLAFRQLIFGTFLKSFSFVLCLWTIPLRISLQNFSAYLFEENFLMNIFVYVFDLILLKTLKDKFKYI